jgi:hypothetical protein
VALGAHLGDGRRAGGLGAGHVRRDNIEAKGGEWSKEDEQAFKKPILEQYDREGHPYYATARLLGRRHPRSGRHAHGAGPRPLRGDEPADRSDQVRRLPDVIGT